MGALILVRYGELALKSPPVRREFERTLQRNIVEAFLREGESCRLRSDHGHLYVEAEDADRAQRILQRVFGVTSVSPVTETPTDLASIGAALLGLSDAVLHPGSRFAVRARRTGQHPFTSQELARDLGGVIFERWPDRGLKVDLDHPEVELFVEVRGPRTYVYLGRRPGPGGLPLGVAGHLVALVDGPRGALGAYLMMKRGCRCAVVAQGPGERLARDVLSRFDPKLSIASSPGATSTDDPLGRLASDPKVDGIVLPLTVDDYVHARERWADQVVFSPTVGLTDSEVEGRWKEVSALGS
ncbi:MAG: THUMP domain-containing protein [Thermoplasmata archaeon]|nr:THUMP domain-containing protein [Thermoplasmata archaeon]